MSTYWKNDDGIVFHSDADLPRSKWRSVAVIDPESDDQVERLANLLIIEAAVSAVAHSGVVAALREFANPTPPKPEEPQGLGAVVEDSDGEAWVRVNRCTGTREWRCCDFAGEFREYEDIPAVRVLSEGVTDR